MNIQTDYPPAYDIVGQYNQDRVNGFDEAFLTEFIEMIDLANATHILDAMSGNGNLSRRLIDFCLARDIAIPALTLLDYSEVQTRFARVNIDSLHATMLHGDILSMTNLQSGKKLPCDYFDWVVIKSGTHEIPLAQQQQLYHSIFQVLKPGGTFINLGFVFHDITERNEFIEITQVKERLVGAVGAVANRYFLLQAEFYQFLQHAGFTGITARRAFEYVIQSDVVQEEYFSKSPANDAISQILAIQRQSTILQAHGRILFEGERSVMRLPGEITCAVKP